MVYIDVFRFFTRVNLVCSMVTIDVHAPRSELIEMDGDDDDEDDDEEDEGSDDEEVFDMVHELYILLLSNFIYCELIMFIVLLCQTGFVILVNSSWIYTTIYCLVEHCNLLEKKKWFKIVSLTNINFLRRLRNLARIT